LTGSTIALEGNITTLRTNCGSGCTPPANQLGDVLLYGPVTLGTDITVNTAGGDPSGFGGYIEFGNASIATPVDGAHSLTLETGGVGSLGQVIFYPGSSVGATMRSTRCSSAAAATLRCEA